LIVQGIGIAMFFFYYYYFGVKYFAVIGNCIIYPVGGEIYFNNEKEKVVGKGRKGRILADWK
jgi:hypothetical protein